MNLYKMTTKGLGDYWVVAPDPTTGQNLLEKELDMADYGYKADRNISSISLITSLLKSNSQGTLQFWTGDKLLISDKQVTEPVINHL